MPRARLSKDGIEIAKAGYDVDTATLPQMAFSSSMVAMRLALTGTVTVVDYSGAFSGEYRRGIVTFPTAFSKPPIVMVAGLRGDGSTDQTTFAMYSFSDQNATGWIRPIYHVVTATTNFELYVMKAAFFAVRPTTWRYFVFQNTLED